MVHRSPGLSALLALLFWGGCADDDLTLVVDLRTDLTPGVEFVGVETRLDDSPAESVTAFEGDSFVTGRRIAELDGLDRGTHAVVVSLLDTTARVVGERRAVVELSQSTGVTIVIARACTDVTCPGAGDAPNQTECLGTICVAPECTPETPESCSPPECAGDGDCPGGAACAVASCVEGACFLSSDDARCASGQRCDVALGCIDVAPPTDAGPSDTGPTDSGPADTGPADACGAAMESCNGTDDDCDDAVDEDVQCRVGAMECQRVTNAGTTYQACDAGLPWSSAASVCAGWGYRLVVIDDAVENAFVASTLSATISGSNAWIGLSDLEVEGSWFWVDGTPEGFSAWAAAQPDDAGSGEDCAMIDFGSGLWSDRDCEIGEPFFCEVIPDPPE